MNKLVHFLGYSVAIVVVGILIMTATGQLSPALRGGATLSSDSSVSPDTSSPRGAMVTPDGKFTVMKDEEGTYTVTENAGTNMLTAQLLADGATGGDTGGGMMAAAAVTCQPSIITRGPQDPPAKNYKINCPTSMPADSYFQAPAITELQNTLGCTSTAAGAAQMTCPDSTNCEKDGIPSLQMPNPFTTCTVANKRRDARTKTCTADVNCGPAQCDYKQNCKPKPRKTCCYSDNKTVATCRDGAGTCATGEEVGTDYAADQCAMNCKPVNTRCCKPTTGAWSCSPTCAAGVTGEIKPIAQCNTMTCSSSSSVTSTPQSFCCKTGTSYTCTTSCPGGQNLGFLGTCNLTTNCRSSSSTPSTTPPPPPPPPSSSCPSSAINQYCKGGNTPVPCPNGCVCRSPSGALVGGIGALEGTCRAN